MILPQLCEHLKKPNVNGQQGVLQCQRKKTYDREFKLKAVGLITEKGYSIAEASRNLGIEYSVLRRWKQQLAKDPENAFPGKGRLKAPDEEKIVSNESWNALPRSVTS